MRAWLKTWRHGVVDTIPYHGDYVSYDAGNSVLYVQHPVLDDGMGDLTVVTVTAGDEFTTAYCPESCEFHPGESRKTITTGIRE